MHIPKILVRGQQIPILAKTAETHAVGVGLEDVVPSPEHVTVNVVGDPVVAP